MYCDIAPDVLWYCDTLTYGKLRGGSEWGMYERGHYCHYKRIPFKYSKVVLFYRLSHWNPLKRSTYCMIYRQKYWYIVTVSIVIHRYVDILLQLCCTFWTSLHPPADIHRTSPAHCILDLWTEWRKSFLCSVQRSSIWLRKWNWRGTVDEAIQNTHTRTHI